MKFSDRAGDRIHKILFSVYWEIVIIIATIIGMIVYNSPWLIPLFVINIYQLLILTPLGWGDRSNDRKLDEILQILYNGNHKE